MKKMLHFSAAFLTITTAFAQAPDSALVEQPDQRTYFSKTYYNPRDNTYKTIASAGYVHYLASDGTLKDIDTHLRLDKSGAYYIIDSGLYNVAFAAASGQGAYDVAYEVPRPVQPKFYDPGKPPAPITRIRWKILSYGYFDRQKNLYQIIQNAPPSGVTPVVSGNTINYPEIFPGIDLRYVCGNVSLKEEIVLSQAKRNTLPDPTKYGLSRTNTYFVVAMEFLLTPNNLNAFARRQGGKTPIKQGNNFSFDGDDPIEFEDENTTLHFFITKDYAHAVADSLTGFVNRTSLRRYFYSQGGKNYMLVGVPWSWINAAPQGNLIIDPTTSVGASDDVWLEDNSTGLGSSTQVIIGKAAGYPKKRTLIKFNITGVPTNATVLNAQMKLYYYTAVRVGTTSWIDRWVQAHQVLVNWNEAQATDDYRLTSTLWNVNYVGLNDIDAKSAYESTTLIQQDYPKWRNWDITSLTQKWVNLSATNYGVVLWATNEATDGYDLRFYSSEYTTDPTLQPKLEITYSTDAKTVYFLKDHLGSTRATVLDSATAPVIGYDDYDPWGYPLALRTKPIPNAYLQGASKNKFTGKEWDDEFGINYYYFGARYYDPQIGRWLSVDPLANSNPSWTPYNYVLNNPINFFDSDGRKEYADGSIHPDSLGAGDWFASDRENNTERWQKANRHNLLQASGYSEYGTMSQREAFYRWLAGSLYGIGSEVKWPAAAAWVNQIVLFARNIDAGLDVVGMGFFSGETVAGLDQINAAIMTHVWGRLGEVYSGSPLVLGQANNWDLQTVIHEQINNPALHQVYAGLSKNSVAELQALLEIPGAVYDANGTTNVSFLGPAFSGSIKLSVHRAAQGLRMINALQTNPQLFQTVLKGR